MKHGKEAPIYKCEQCPYVTLKSSNLARHNLVHRKDKPAIDCPHCDSIFLHGWLLKRHIESKHQDLHVHCALCQKVYKRRDTLKEHMLKEHTTSKVSLSATMWGTFENDNESEISDTNSFSCDQCVFFCNRASKLEKHKEMKHAEEESFKGQSRATKYRQLKRMREDAQTSDYMKKKMRQSEDDQIVDMDIEKMMIENPLMSNEEIVRNLQVIRKRLGKAAFHTNVRRAMKRRRNLLEEYHETEFRTFEDGDREEVERPLTFINDMNAFIAAICDKRDHSDENLTIALGLDGGQGKLISTLTVSPEGEGNKAERKKTNNSLKSTGTRRAFVAARVDGVPETYSNLTQLLSPLNLPTLDKDFGVVCDLKVINILVGLQSCSSRHSCPFCQGAKYDKNGDFAKDGLWNLDAVRRDFENLSSDYVRYREEANDRRRLKDFNSVEFPPIMIHKDQMSIPIMALLPPPELHTGLLGPVNQTIKMLKQIVPGVEDFMKMNNIKGSGCGGDLNGPTIKKLLQNYNNQLTNLEILCRSVSEEHVLFINHLRNINLLHTLVNSHTLQLETIRSVINQMRETFLKLHTVFGMNETLKLHVIFSHYMEYFELTGHTLLRFSDEVTEAVHSQLRMFEERHKLKRNNKSSQGHADAQHTCVVFYNSVALGDI